MLLIILAIFALALVFLGYLYKKTEKLGQTVFPRLDQSCG